MTATEINPLYLREPSRKFVFDVLQGSLKNVGTALAMAMTVEAANVTGQLLGQLVGTDTKACAWSARIIKQRAHLRVFRIDTQAQRALPCPTMIPLVLRKRIERQMTGTTNYLVDLVILVSRREGMSLRTKLLESQTSLRE